MSADLNEVELFAWLGMDELGSGEIGLKQAQVPAGMIPLVAVKRHKVESTQLTEAMEMQAEVCGKKIRLCRFTLAEVIRETRCGTDQP